MRCGGGGKMAVAGGGGTTLVLFVIWFLLNFGGNKKKRLRAKSAMQQVTLHDVPRRRLVQSMWWVARQHAKWRVERRTL